MWRYAFHGDPMGNFHFFRGFSTRHGIVTALLRRERKKSKKKNDDDQCRTTQ